MVTIEPAGAGDSHAIARVHVGSWQAAYVDIVSAESLAALSVEQRETSWRTQLTDGAPQVLVARDRSLVIGFVAFGPCRDSDAQPSWGEIWALYVSPLHWHSGAGRAPWLAAQAALAAHGYSTVTLWVLSLNALGKRFYSAAGFVPEPHSEKLFRLGEQELAEVRLVYEHVASPLRADSESLLRGLWSAAHAQRRTS